MQCFLGQLGLPSADPSNWSLLPSFGSKQRERASFPEAEPSTSEEAGSSLELAAPRTGSRVTWEANQRAEGRLDVRPAAFEDRRLRDRLGYTSRELARSGVRVLYFGGGPVEAKTFEGGEIRSGVRVGVIS